MKMGLWLALKNKLDTAISKENPKHSFFLKRVNSGTRLYLIVVAKNTSCYEFIVVAK